MEDENGVLKTCVVLRGGWQLTVGWQPMEVNFHCFLKGFTGNNGH